MLCEFYLYFLNELEKINNNCSGVYHSWWQDYVSRGSSFEDSCSNQNSRDPQPVWLSWLERNPKTGRLCERFPVRASPPRGPPPCSYSQPAPDFSVFSSSAISSPIYGRKGRSKATSCKVSSSSESPATLFVITYDSQQVQRGRLLHQPPLRARLPQAYRQLTQETLWPWKPSMTGTLATEGWSQTPNPKESWHATLTRGPKSTATKGALTWFQDSFLHLCLCLLCLYLACFLNWVLLLKLTETSASLSQESFHGFQTFPFSQIPQAYWAGKGYFN